MIKNYLKIAWRNLLRNKVFSLINILGLAIGIAACLLILQYVRFEMSYDQFHEKADQIYRVRHDKYINGELQYQKAQAFIPTGETMKNDFPEVLEYATLFRVSEQIDVIMTYQPEEGDAVRFAEKEVYFAKGNFLDVFTLSILEGQKDLKALEPHTMLLSASAARKYFGNQSAIGKKLNDHTIIGIFKDLPKNSHLKIDFLLGWDSISGDKNYDDSNWRWDGFYTYLLLNPEADPNELETKFPELVSRYMGEQNSQRNSKFILQPLTDIHLNSHLQGEVGSNGDVQIVYALLGLAVFVLLIAWINYINLSVSRSLDRVQEIGIRKAIGSVKSQIVKQFLIESLLTNLLAVAVALAFILLLASSFAAFTGIELSLDLFSKAGFWAIVLFLLLVGSFAAGSYPAFIISSFKTVKALKGKTHDTISGSFFNLRHALVIFQFSISIALMAATLVAYKQLSFMKTQNLGISIDDTLVINTHATQADSLFMRNLSVLKNKLDAYSMIEGVTASYDIPGKEHLSNFPDFRHSKNPEELVFLYFTRIDYDFIPEFKVDLVAGRNFKEGVDNRYSMIMNVEAIEALGFEEPQDAIGYEVRWGSEQNPGKAEIVGVVDFRSTSLKQKNHPVAYTSVLFPFKYLSVRFDQLNGRNAQRSISIVKNSWEEVFQEIPFDYFFLDDFFNRQYLEDQKFSQLLTIFTMMAIVVACLGLYAVASLTVVRRTKEVGVRKILGASTKSLLFLLSKEFFLLVLIAGGISIPIMLSVVTEWLKKYPYRIDLSWWVFLLPIVLILLIAMFTIGYKIILSSLSNPVKSLKYE
ncbi:ABC transporter permease [Pararhodonellum marinum]|uniref:ABC transporter permease n=1 Tax=Pararhodonellum marinum TaxID=2755358 RepID=UPI00189030E8|nr:ABC transporter permease [Pararhodonellum marinum]